MARPNKKEKARYSVLRPIVFKGDRVEAGAVLELSGDDLKNMNRAYVEEIDPEVEKAKEEDTKKEDLKKQEGNDIEI